MAKKKSSGLRTRSSIPFGLQRAEPLFNLASPDGTNCGTVSYDAYKAAQNFNLDSYTPRSQEEKEVIDKFRNSQVELKAPGGVVYGKVSYDAYAAIQKLQLDSYTPKDDYEKGILDHFNENAVYSFYDADGQKIGNVTYGGYSHILNKGFDGYDAKNSWETKTISNLKQERNIPLIIEVDGKEKNFGNINYYEYQYLNGKSTNSPIPGGKSQAVQDYEKYLADEAKKAREPEEITDIGSAMRVAGNYAGYTLEKIGAGAVDAVHDASDFMYAAGATMLRPFTWGDANKAVKEFANEKLNNDNTYGDQWNASIESRYRVPDWYREYVGETAFNFGGLLPATAMEMATFGVAPAYESMALRTATTAGKVSKTANLASKLIKPKVSDTVFFLGAAGSSSKAAYAETGDALSSLSYGVLNGVGEVFSEKLFGGYGGTGIGAVDDTVRAGNRVLKAGVSDDIFDLSKIKGVSKLASNKYGKKVLDIAMEGVEEVVMTDLEPWFRKATIDPDAEISNFTQAEFWQERGSAFSSGVMLSAFSNAANYPLRKYQKNKSIKALNEETAELNASLPSEAQFAPLKHTASMEKVEARAKDIQRTKAIIKANAVSDSINAILKNDADKLQLLKYDSTETEIKQRQNEIAVFGELMADLTTSELVKNNPEKFADIKSEAEANGVELVAEETATTTTVSVGDTFINTKSNNIIKVVEQNDSATKVEVTTPDGKKEIKVVSNKQAAQLIADERYEKVESPTVSKKETTTTPTETSAPRDINLTRMGKYYAVYGEDAKALATYLKTKTQKRSINGVETDVLFMPADKALELAPAIAEDFNLIFSDKPSTPTVTTEVKNEVVADESTVTNEDTSTDDVGATESEILVISKAVDDTLVPEAKDGILKGASNQGVDNGIIEFAEGLTSVYKQSGTLAGMEKFFSDGGKKVIDTIEGRTETTDTKVVEEKNNTEVLNKGSESDTLKEKETVSEEVDNLEQQRKDLYSQLDDISTFLDEMSEQGVDETEIIKTEQLYEETLDEIKRVESEIRESKKNKSKSVTEESPVVEREDNGNGRKRNSILPENSGRSDNGGTEKQAERLPSFEQRNKGKNETERRKFTSEILDREQVEVVNDGNHEYVRVKPEAYNDDMLSMVEDAKSKGVELGFFVGNARVIGEEITDDFYVDGIKLNSSKVLVRYDGSRTPQKIAKHEMVHAKWHTSAIQKIKDTILGSLTAKEKQAILSQERYARYKSEAYNGSEEIALEEFVCDVMAEMNDYITLHEETVNNYWYGDESVESYNAADYATSTDAGGDVRYSLFPGGVFPPYNKSHSDANERATRWAHNDDIETGAQRIFFYKGSPYLVEKFDSMDLGYLVIKKLTKKSLSRYERNMIEYEERDNDGRNNGSQPRRKDSVSDNERHQGLRESARRSSDDNNGSDKHNRETTETQRVGREQDEKRNSRNNRSRDNKHSVEDSKGEVKHSLSTKSKDVRYSISKSQNTDYAPTFYSKMGQVIDEMKQDKIGANSVVSYLTGRGVKAEEIKWTGIEEFLDGKKSVTKAELQEFVANNQLEIKSNLSTENSTIDYTEQERDSLDVIENGINEAWEEVRDLWEDRFGEEIPMDIMFSDNATSLAMRELRRRAGDNFDALCEGISKCIDDIEMWESRQNYIVSQAKERGGHGTRWEQYKLDGGENYREVTFEMPNSDYTNSAMRTHWGDDAKGILAHARVQDFDVDGKKMLFIEEIQSDWHNEGHKRGYRQKGQKTENDIRRAENEAYEKFWESHVIQRICQKLKEAEYESDAAVVANLWEGNTTSTYAFLERLGITLTNDEKGYIEEQVYQSKERNESLKDAVSEYTPPEAPYSDNYHEYVLKNLIRMAAEEGYDSIGWTTADIQSNRWSEDYAEGYRIEYDQDIPKFLNKYGKKWGAKVGHTTLNGGENTNLDKDKATFRWDLDEEAFGNEEIYEYTLQYDGEDTDVVYTEEQLMNEGVNVEYGDEILNYLWKEYSRGISGDVVWSMPITDAMKESVLYEGQARYSISKPDNLKTQKRIEGIAQEIGSHEEFIELAKQNTQEFVGKIKENENLQKRLNNAKRQMLKSPKPAVNMVQVGKITQEILKEVDSTLNAKDLREEITSIYNEYFAAIKDAKGVESKVNEANDIMLERFGKLAVDIANSGEAFTESEEYEMLKSYIKNTRIKVPDSAKADAHFGEFRKSHMGTFNLTNDGTDIDVVYMELCSLFPGKFDETISHPADQLLEMDRVLEGLKPYAYNPNLEYMEDVVEHIVNRFAYEVDGLAVMPKTKAQKMAEKSAVDKEMALEKERTKFEQQMEKHKKDSEDVIRKLQKKIDDAKYVRYWEGRLSKEEKAQAINKIREKRDIAILKTQIKNIVSDMNNKMNKSEKSGGYPKELVQAAADVCSVIDFHTGRTNKDGTPTKASLKLDALKAEYEALKDNPNYDFSSEYSEELKGKIETLRVAVKEKRVIDLTIGELANLKDILSEISHSLSIASKQIGIDNALENREIATEIINSLKSDKKAISEIRNRLLKWMKLAKERGKAFVINPHRVFEMIANYDKNSEWWKLYDQILRGSRKVAKFTMDATMPFDELTDGGGNEIAFFDFRTKTHKTGIKYQDGTEVELPKSIICELVMLWDRKQGRKHLETGGIKVPDLKYFNKGKTTDAKDSGKLTRAITQSDIDRLKGMLDSYDKAWIEKSRHLFNKVAKDAINETSMQLVGRELAKTDNYIRIYVDSDFVKKDIGKDTPDITIEGHGSLKETTPDAKNPLILRGLHENVYEHIDFASKYYGLAIPIRNFNKVYGISINDNGNFDSVKNTLGSVFGSRIRDGVVVKAIKELQSPRTKELTIFNKIKGNWLNATFWGNARSMMKQTTSYWTAASILDESSLVKGLASYNVHRKQTKAEIAKYSGTLYKRSQGLSTTELGDRANRKRLAGASSKVTKVVNKVAPWVRKIPEWVRPGNWLQSMDCAVSSALWDACKHQVSKTMKATDNGYMEAVADLYERVIEETQSNYDVLHRPEILKTTGEGWQAIGMFQTDNLQQTGIIYGAFSDLQEKSKAYKANKNSVTEQNLKDAKKRMGKAIRSRVYSSVWIAAVTALGNALLRKFKPYIDEEEKEITAGSVAEQMLFNVGEDMLGVFVPVVGSFAGDAVATFKYGYDLATVPAIDVLEDFINATSKIWDAYAKEDGDVAKAWTDAIPAISNMTGIPAKNIMDLYNAVEGYIGDIKEGEFAHDLTDYSGGKSFYTYDDLAKYIVSGDKEKEKKLLDYYSANGTKISQGSLTNSVKPAYVQMYTDSPEQAKSIKRKLILEYDFAEKTIDNWTIAEYFKHAIPGKKYNKDVVSDPEYASEVASAVQKENGWKSKYYTTIKSQYKTVYKKGNKADTEALKKALIKDFQIATGDIKSWEASAEAELKKKADKQEAEKKKFR